MSYTPLKKEIVFSDDVKKNPHYRSVMQIIKSLGDQGFKHWLVQYIAHLPATLNDCANTSSELLASYEDLKAIGVLLDGLVSREVQVEDDMVEACKQAFLPVPNPPMVELLKNLMGFLLNTQTFERMIIKIDQDIEAGNIPSPKRHLTRDGSAPVVIPRSRQ